MSTLAASQYNLLIKKKELPPVQSPAQVLFTPFKKGETESQVGKRIWMLLEKLSVGDMVQSGFHVGIKQHFGEEGNEGYIKPNITREVASGITELGGKPSLIETNTLYAGTRANSYDHIKTASNHGFTFENVGAPVVIIDGMTGQNIKFVEVNGKHHKQVALGGDITAFNTIVGLTHVKGHPLGGMGGTMKNLAMGIACRQGKLEMHADYTPEIHHENCVLCGSCVYHCPEKALCIQDGKLVLDKTKCIGCGECVTACGFDAIRAGMDQLIGFDGDEKGLRKIQERMAEYASGIVSLFPKKAIYINVINHLSKLCDCWGGENPIMGPDVGILVSKDPVAIDVASFDLVKSATGKDIFKEAAPSTDFMHGMKYLENMGGGTTKYSLKEL